MILPTVSIFSSKFYNHALKYCTIREDLRLFPFDGFKTPLMKHICLLYFIQPSFASHLTSIKEKRVIHCETILDRDNTKIKITHVPEPKRKGGSKNNLSDKEKNYIIEKYNTGKSINHIQKQLKRGTLAVKKCL
jgi:hypothetical protein